MSSYMGRFIHRRNIIYRLDGQIKLLFDIFRHFMIIRFISRGSKGFKISVYAFIGLTQQFVDITWHIIRVNPEYTESLLINARIFDNFHYHPSFSSIAIVLLMLLQLCTTHRFIMKQ